MKKNALFTALCFLMALNIYAFSFDDDVSPEKILIELTQQLRVINANYSSQIKAQEIILTRVNGQLICVSDYQEKVDLLIQKE